MNFPTALGRALRDVTPGPSPLPGGEMKGNFSQQGLGLALDLKLLPTLVNK